MSRTGRSALFSDVRRAFCAARIRNNEEAAASVLPSASPALTRRKFLQASTATLLSAYAGSAEIAGASSFLPKIAVVGAGIAGLNATYHLKKAGFRASLYEASNHIGGRIQTNYHGVAPNVYTELGGEFIDSDHDDMLALAQEFDLDLIDTQAKSETGLQIAYYAEGMLRTEEDIITAFQPLATAVDNDLAQLSDTITYSCLSDFDAALDQMTLREYLTRNEIVDWLFKILEAAYVNEYGLNLEDQSSLNFVQTIGTDTSDGFQIYGESDQRYKIRGGNQQIVNGLAQRVADRIVLGQQLEALTQNENGQYLLSFQNCGAGRREVRADFVILCLPFSILREVNLHLPLPTVKRRAIQELGYGASAKLILGFQNRVWRTEGFSGDSYADQPYQSGWDSSRKQHTPYGAYTIFPGGTRALELGNGTAFRQAHRLLPGLNRVFPHVEDQWLGTAVRAYWPSNPYVKAGYASYLPGQWTRIRGAEGQRVGNLYFAGEHTSLDWQGYMNGGAESGRLAAQALQKRLK